MTILWNLICSKHQQLRLDSTRIDLLHWQRFHQNRFNTLTKIPPIRKSTSLAQYLAEMVNPQLIVLLLVVLSNMTLFKIGTILGKRHVSNFVNLVDQLHYIKSSFFNHFHLRPLLHLKFFFRFRYLQSCPASFYLSKTY